MKLLVLDLSRKNCHACGHPLTRDIKNQVEYCTYYACLIRNVEFTIPFKAEEVKA